MACYTKQKKMEGQNFEYYGMPELFAVARQFELWIMGAPGRLSDVVMDAISEAVDDIEKDGEDRQ